MRKYSNLNCWYQKFERQAYLHAVFLGQRWSASQQAATSDHSESSLTTSRDAFAPTARSLPRPLQWRPRSTARDILRHFRWHFCHHCNDSDTAVSASTNLTAPFKPIRRRYGHLSRSDATISLSVMQSRLPQIQIQTLCNGLYCDDAAAPNAVMPQLLYRWCRHCLRLVRVFTLAPNTRMPPANPPYIPH